MRLGLSIDMALSSNLISKTLNIAFIYCCLYFILGCPIYRLIWSLFLFTFFNHICQLLRSYSFHSPIRLLKSWYISYSLAYLHEAIEPKVVHRDIKSSNILIDDDFNSKVSDFGLAKLLGAGKSHITTRVMGTFGWVSNVQPARVMLSCSVFLSFETWPIYCEYFSLFPVPFCRYVAPEYANTGLLNEKSDIYSFGVVLLEAITGRDPVDYSRPAHEV